MRALAAICWIGFILALVSLAWNTAGIGIAAPYQPGIWNLPTWDIGPGETILYYPRPWLQNMVQQAVTVALLAAAICVTSLLPSAHGRPKRLLGRWVARAFATGLLAAGAWYWLPQIRAGLELESIANRYFPRGALHPHPDGDRGRRIWYSTPLAALEEPSLRASPAPSDEAYRFLFLPSFHQELAVRVERTGATWRIVAKEIGGDGRREPVFVQTEIQRELKQDEWVRLRHLVKEAGFFDLPSQDTSRGLDGAEWILEGRVGDRYHVVDRWCPPTGPYKDLCVYLLKCSGLKTRP